MRMPSTKGGAYRGPLIGSAAATLSRNSHSLALAAASSQYAYIADASQAGLDPAGSFTIECWNNPDSLPAVSAYATLVSKYNTTANGSYMLRVFAGAGPLYYVYFDIVVAATIYTLRWSLSPVAGEWRHYALVYDATAQWQNQKFYIDGVDQGAASVLVGTAATVYGAVDNSTADFRVGARAAGTSPWDGKLDDFRFWNKVRSGAEILADYRRQLAGSETNLDGYWKFNGTLDDVTANANALTGSGSPAYSTDTPF